MADKQFSEQDFAAMLKPFMEQMNANNLTAIREMKKLPEHEQEALDKKRSLEVKNRTTRIQESIAQETTRQNREFACELGGHVKSALGIQFPQHALSGQVNSDGCFRALCIRCFKTFPPVKATDEQSRSGVHLLNMRGLTAEVLYTWHIKSIPDCKDCKANGCAVKGLRQLKNRAIDPVGHIPEGKVAAASVA